VNVEHPDAQIRIEKAETETMGATPAPGQVTPNDRNAMANIEQRIPRMADMTPMVGYRVLALIELTGENLTGARVYDLNDEWIGEVSELLIEAARVTDVVIDVGGFLGSGGKARGDHAG